MNLKKRGLRLKIKVKHQGQVPENGFSEILDLEYVRFDTKIESLHYITLHYVISYVEPRNVVCRVEKRRSRCFERVYRCTRLAQDRSYWINQLRSSQLVYQRVQHEFWQTIITNSSGNARKLWNSLSSVMGRNRQSSTISSGLTADSFANFFRDKVSDVRSSTAGAADPEYTYMF